VHAFRERWSFALLAKERATKAQSHKDLSSAGGAKRRAWGGTIRPKTKRLEPVRFVFRRIFRPRVVPATPADPPNWVVLGGVPLAWTASTPPQMLCELCISVSRRDA
jgi:hypothetical protein